MNDAEVDLACLASLPSMGPRRLQRVLEHHSAADALERLVRGSGLVSAAMQGAPRDLVGRLTREAALLDRPQLLARLVEHEIAVVGRHDPAYPAALSDDVDAPAVLFARGDFATLARRRVGIVGTRNATAAGRATASELAEALAACDVAVVSGLARGIDAAAHRGSRAASGPAAAVVGNGLDVAYPRQNADLWSWVAQVGLLLSEWPPGTTPDAWRFPLRNRILAALCEVVVVVESRERGGSLITARLALDRGVTVLAVPGSPRNRASAGTNQLLVEGAAPVTCVDDVLVALELNHVRATPCAPPTAALARGDDADVLALCADRPCTIGLIAELLDRSVAGVVDSLERLDRLGLVTCTQGWFESTRSRL